MREPARVGGAALDLPCEAPIEASNAEGMAHHRALGGALRAIQA